MNENTISAIAIVVIAILFAIEKVATQKTIASLTEALKEAKDNTMLVDQARALATEVIPTEVGARLIHTIDGLAALMKPVIPNKEIDDVINAADSLADKILAQPPAATPGV